MKLEVLSWTALISRQYFSKVEKREKRTKARERCTQPSPGFPTRSRSWVQRVFQSHFSCAQPSALPATTGAIQMPQAGPQLAKPTGRSSPQAREPLLRGQTSERRPAPSTQAWKTRRQPRTDRRHLPRAAPSAVYFRTSPAIVPIGRCRAVERCLHTAPAPRGSARPCPAWAPEALRGGGGRGLWATLSSSLEPVALCFGAVESPSPPPPRGESKDLYGSEKVALSPFLFL